MEERPNSSVRHDLASSSMNEDDSIYRLNLSPLLDLQDPRSLGGGDPPAHWETDLY